MTNFLTKSQFRYARVNTRLWNDEKVRGLSLEAKLIWLRLLVPLERTRVPGLFQAWPDAIRRSTGVNGIAFERSWKEVTTTFDMQVDEDWGLIYLRNAVQHDPPRNPNMVKGWLVSLNELPECALKVLAIQELSAFLAMMGESFQEPLLQLLGEYNHNHDHNHDHNQSGAPNEAEVSRETAFDEKRKVKQRSDDIEAVWTHYADSYNRVVNKKRRLGKSVRKKLATRLNEYTVDELKEALDRMFTDEWSIQHGALEIGRVIHSLEKVDKWLSKPDVVKEGTSHKPNGRVVQIGGPRPGDAEAIRQRLNINYQQREET